MKDTFLQ